MCLLIHQPSTTVFSDAFLADVYQANSDGLGIMYAHGGVLVVRKSLPASSADFIRFYREHAEGRECVVHARMKTHGDIDLDNCHPYAVSDRVALAHNGILSTGNSWDRSKSDTWHFVRNVVGPALEAREDLLRDPSWLSFVGDLIGSNNKFGLMSADGVVAIVNRASGVEYEGAWLSNTYAWSAHRFMSRGRGVFHTDAFEYEAMPRWWPSQVGRELTLPAVSQRGADDSLHRITRAARNSYLRGHLDQWVADAPHKAARLLDAIEEDPTGAAGDRVYKNPRWVADRIEEYFEAEGRGMAF